MSDTATHPVLLTIKQLAAAIAKDYPDTAITEISIRRFLKLGLPHSHIGNTIFVIRENYDAWILSQMTTTFTPFHSEDKA